MEQVPLQMFVVERCDEKEGWSVVDYKQDSEGYAEPYLFESRDEAWLSVRELLGLQKEFKLLDSAHKDEFRIVSAEDAYFSQELFDKLHPCDQMMYTHLKRIILGETAQDMAEMLKLCQMQDDLLTRIYVKGYSPDLQAEVRQIIGITQSFLNKTRNTKGGDQHGGNREREDEMGQDEG